MKWIKIEKQAPPSWVVLLLSDGTQVSTGGYTGNKYVLDNGHFTPIYWALISLPEE